MMELLAEEKRRRLEAAIKNREYLVKKAQQAVQSVEGEHAAATAAAGGPSKRARGGDGGGGAASAASAFEKLAAGGGGVTSADVVAMYGGPNKKRKRKGNPGVYIQGLPKHLTEVELRIALQRVCERQAGPVRRIKIYHMRDDPGVVKGDALVIFELPKDAIQAVEAMNGEQLQAGFPMTVSRAQFDGDSSGGDGGGGGDGCADGDAGSSAAGAAADGGDGGADVSRAPAGPQPNPFGGKRGSGYAPLPLRQLGQAYPEDAAGPMSFAPPPAFAAQAAYAAAAAAVPPPPPAAPIMAQAISGTVLLYNVFDPSRELNPYLGHKSELKGIEQEMYQEVQRFGVVSGFDILQDGSVIIVYADKDAAARCVDVMHGRWFNERQMVADYLPDGTTAKHIPRLSKAVVLGNVFDPANAMRPRFVEQLCQDFEIQCQGYGPIEKLDVSWTETTSSITIIYVSSISAADCIAGMNNLTCDGRQLSASYDPSYLVTDKEAAAARQLSLTEKQRREREEDARRQQAALEEAERKGAAALAKEKEFQAFWKTVNEDAAGGAAAGPVLGGGGGGGGGDDDDGD